MLLKTITDYDNWEIVQFVNTFFFFCISLASRKIDRQSSNFYIFVAASEIRGMFCRRSEIELVEVNLVKYQIRYSILSIINPETNVVFFYSSVIFLNNETHFEGLFCLFH